MLSEHESSNAVGEDESDWVDEGCEGQEKSCDSSWSSAASPTSHSAARDHASAQPVVMGCADKFLPAAASSAKSRSTSSSKTDSTRLATSARSKAKKYATGDARAALGGYRRPTILDCGPPRWSRRSAQQVHEFHCKGFTFEWGGGSPADIPAYDLSPSMKLLRLSLDASVDEAPAETACHELYSDGPKGINTVTTALCSRPGQTGGRTRERRHSAGAIVLELPRGCGVPSSVEPDVLRGFLRAFEAAGEAARSDLAAGASLTFRADKGEAAVTPSAAAAAASGEAAEGGLGGNSQRSKQKQQALAASYFAPLGDELYVGRSPQRLQLLSPNRFIGTVSVTTAPAAAAAESQTPSAEAATAEDADSASADSPSHSVTSWEKESSFTTWHSIPVIGASASTFGPVPRGSSATGATPAAKEEEAAASCFAAEDLPHERKSKKKKAKTRQKDEEGTCGDDANT